MDTVSDLCLALMREAAAQDSPYPVPGTVIAACANLIGQVAGCDELIGTSHSIAREFDTSDADQLQPVGDVYKLLTRLRAAFDADEPAQLPRERRYTATVMKEVDEVLRAYDLADPRP